MKSIDFPEANLALAKDQPEYSTLYVHVAGNKEGQMICQFELTDEQIEDIVKNKKLYYSQFTFGNLFQPMLIMTKNPFPEPIETDKLPMDENRVGAYIWDREHFIDSNTTGVHTGRGYCMNCGKMFEEHFWSSRQCEL